jgi:hypothetical protein
MRPLTIILIVAATMAAACSGAGKKQKPQALSAVFQLGTVRFISSQKKTDKGYEFTLMSRYNINKKELNSVVNNYFHYQLGKHIKLLVGQDTISPALSYSMPLIADTEKEVDCKYQVSDADIGKPKRIIYTDSIYDLEKINISIK